MASAQGNGEDGRRSGLSPRPKGRGCAFSHDKSRFQPESSRKAFNVDSPSFTPSALPVNSSGQRVRGLSPKAASAAPFRPKSATSASSTTSQIPLGKPYNPNAPDWLAPSSTPEIPEFVPSNFNNIGNEFDYSHTTPFESDPFGNSTNLFNNNAQPQPSTSHNRQPPQMNPYAQETNEYGGSTYFQGQNNFAQPLQHHLYASWGPPRENLPPSQRAARDFFIPEDLRQQLQKKTEATLRSFSGLQLPDVEQFHSLISVDLPNSKSDNLLEYPSWLYKAVSSHDGHSYCLRRLEGFVSSNQSHNDVKSVAHHWKRVRNANVVTVHLAFANSRFGTPSLFFVNDFHPLSETLAQKHFTQQNRYSNRHNASQIPETTLWSYISQISNALKAIHDAGLAAKVIDSTKIILTSENRLRLSACAVLDVVQGQTPTPLTTYQIQDLYLFGTLLLALGTNNASTTTLKANQPKALELFRRNYSPRLCAALSWLLEHDPENITNTDPIDSFLALIASHLISAFDASLHASDTLTTQLNRELENSRLVRLLMKINTILERPENEHDGKWSVQGKYYPLVLLRDYIFHPVDAQGRPMLDLGHTVGCLNKLDGGLDERVMMVTRDEETQVLMSWKEIKALLESAWGEVVRRRGVM